MKPSCVAAMAKFTLTSIALKWYFFCAPSSIYLYGEYFSLYMKQLGFNSEQIGLTNLFGVTQLLIPLCLFFSERFRARKAVAVFATLGTAVCCSLPLLAIVIPEMKPICHSKADVVKSNDSLKVIQNGMLNYGSLHLKYATFINRNTSNAIKTDYPIAYLSYTVAPVSSTTSGKLRPSYLNNSQNLSIQHSAHTTTPLHSNNLTQTSPNVLDGQSSVSDLLPLLIFSRSLTMVFERVDLAQGNLATITYLKNEKENYGNFFMWSHIGGAFSIASTALFALWVKINICGVEKYGYFIAFIFGGVMSLLSTLSLPWFKFEYNEKKNFNWSGVKSDVLNGHHIFMFIVLFYTGLCMTFQVLWEFWYLDGLSASPLLLGGAVLIRRPIVAMSTFVSTHLIRKIGDLKTVCVALFLYSLSFLALSFTRKPWLVLMIDTLQGAAYGFSYCAFTVHFYKASSKENSNMILGKKWSTSKLFKYCISYYYLDIVYLNIIYYIHYFCNGL